MPDDSTSPRFDSLAEFRGELEAMPDGSVRRPRVDVAKAALIAIGAMPSIETQRATVVARFGEGGAHTLDRLGPVSRGLLLAQATFVAASEDDLEGRARELMGVRNTLDRGRTVLIERGLVSRKALAGLTGGQSYQARVTDTLALVDWYRRLPAETRALTKVTDALLERASTLANTFGSSFAASSRSRTGADRAAEDRARMFTLFFDTYDRVRQMFAYLRWHQGDADRFAPSIHSGRSASHHEMEPADADTPTASPSSSTPSVTPSPVVSPDLPGADPFAR